MLIAISGRTDLNIRQDPERMRPSDLQWLVGNCSAFHLITGWQPEIKFETTLKDIYEYFANR